MQGGQILGKCCEYLPILQFRQGRADGADQIFRWMEEIDCDDPMGVQPRENGQIGRNKQIVSHEMSNCSEDAVSESRVIWQAMESSHL